MRLSFKCFPSKMIHHNVARISRHFGKGAHKESRDIERMEGQVLDQNLQERNVRVNPEAVGTWPVSTVEHRPGALYIGLGKSSATVRARSGTGFEPRADCHCEGKTLAFKICRNAKT